MHDDDNLTRTSDALLAKIRVVGDQVTAMMAAAQVLRRLPARRPR